LFSTNLSLQPVQRLVVAKSQSPEHLGSLKDPPSNRFGDFLGEQEQLVLVGFERLGALADQGFAGIIPEVQLLILDL